MSNWTTYIDSLSLVEQITIGSFIVGVIGLILFILFHFSKNRYYRKAKIRKYYSVVWKKSKSLKPEQVLRIRGSKNLGFHPYYYERTVDSSILEKVTAGENVIVVGAPLAGKTRTIYQIFKKLINCEVIIPKVVNIDTEDFLIPRSFTPWRRKILFLDDLYKYTVFQNFSHLLNDFAAKKVVVVATCRSGPELERVKKALEQYFSSLFPHKVEVGRIDEKTAEKIAAETDRELSRTFDGNIGSIFLLLDTMKDRYSDCNEIEKCILRSVKRLNLAGIIEERETFSRDCVKKVCVERDKIEIPKYEWNKHFDQIEKYGLFIVENELIKTEETYIEHIIEGEIDILANLNEMMAIFSDDPNVLFEIGSRANDIGNVDINKAVYMRIAISAFKKALKYWTLDCSEEKYAALENNLAVAYLSLAEIEYKAENCRLAIGACKEALKVFTAERFPMDYAMIQINLGTAHRILSEVEDGGQNCRLAIEACKESLKIFTLERFPLNYAGTQNNLGVAFGSLSGIEDKAGNSERALKAFKEALKVYTLELFPEDYAKTQNNLGNAYEILAGEKLESKGKICKLAIKAHNEALKVNTLERLPMQYAATQNNLGMAYHTLSDVDDEVGNCGLAIRAYNEALKVRNIDLFPMQYAKTQNNMGKAYLSLFAVEAKAENCRLAIKAYEEALKVYTLERFPMDYARSQNNLGVAYSILAEEVRKLENCEKGRIAFEEALKVFKKEDLPQAIEEVKENLQLLKEFRKSD